MFFGLSAQPGLFINFTTENTEIMEKSYKKENIEQYFHHHEYLCFLNYKLFFLCVLCGEKNIYDLIGLAIG